MSGLVGAWSLDGLAIGDRLPARDRQSMRTQLATGDFRFEWSQDRVWLCASAVKSSRRPVEGLAYEGFIAGLDDPDAIETLFDTTSNPDWLEAVEGHFVLVHADLRRQRLTLARSPSGGERLYLLRAAGLLLFASSLRPLLALAGTKHEINERVASEALLVGHTVFGCGTLVAGIDEVLAAHVVHIDAVVHPQQCVWRSRLQSIEGPPATVAPQFRAALTTAVAKAAGRQRPVAVALSGGIDSSAIAAAAVDAFGADQVEAISYEFDDPTHPCETPFAAMVCRSLGIRRHHIFQISKQSFLDAIPESVWRSESLVHWPKSFLLPVARELHDRGYDRYLTGFGIGSHMGYLDDLTRLLALPGGHRLFRRWTERNLDNDGLARHFGRIHPGLDPPHRRLYYMLVVMLQRAGLIRDITRCFPAAMHGLLDRALTGATDAVAGSPTPLVAALQIQAFGHLLGCIDVTRSEKSSREVGCLRVSPAHFASCIPYAFFPVQPRPPVWSAARRQRPGKQLLQIAYRGILPDEVLFRTKSWADAVASPDWLSAGRTLMLRSLPHFPNSLASIAADHPSAVRFWEPYSIHSTGLGLAFWRQLLIDSPSVTAPSWHDLLGAERAA